MLLPVFPRGGADIGLEYPGKVAGGGKPEIRPDGGEGLIGIAEEALGFLGLFLQDKIGEGLAGFLLEPAGEIGPADEQLFRNFFRRDGLGEVCWM